MRPDRAQVGDVLLTHLAAAVLDQAHFHTGLSVKLLEKRGWRPVERIHTAVPLISHNVPYVIPVSVSVRL